MAGAGPRDFDPFSRAFVTDPYPLLATMRREAAVHYVRQPNRIERYVVLRHGEGRAVLTDPLFSADPAYASEALQPAAYLTPAHNTGPAAPRLPTPAPP